MMSDEQPRNVKDLLIEAKDASELMVDLAYAAVVFNEEDLARDAETLEERMDANLRRLLNQGHITPDTFINARMNRNDDEDL